MISKGELHRLGLEARTMLEDYVLRHPGKFHHPNPRRLEGCCGVAAWFLCRHLYRMAGISALLVYGSFKGVAPSGVVYKDCDHAWAEIDDLVLDLTATQYGPQFVPVEIMSKRVAEAVGYVGELEGFEAYDFLSTWTVGPQDVGPSLARFADRKYPQKRIQPRVRRFYGAGEKGKSQ